MLNQLYFRVIYFSGNETGSRHFDGQCGTLLQIYQSSCVNCKLFSLVSGKASILSHENSNFGKLWLVMSHAWALYDFNTKKLPGQTGEVCLFRGLDFHSVSNFFSSCWSFTHRLTFRHFMQRWTSHLSLCCGFRIPYTRYIIGFNRNISWTDAPPSAFGD